MPNVTVKLLDGTNKVVDTKTTDASGFYNFAAVLPAITPCSLKPWQV
ncbi:hypothetical protein [Candidatus Thiothrix anitrata]|uniref:Carboxypeptidase regulatory-like domain-containing protein n=1 Tax=Candidatus Thiothrix anitrata TaxID=2823902 RepID=A0ABX7X7I6_9GAMM|nr:hypothetical protein [Candidatus Thiothrix anitrata]QTR50174.1 hypothetical protein J8380_00885 [Candidatus Thiothrix anitrata]